MKLFLTKHVIFLCFLIVVPLILAISYIIYRVCTVYVPSDEEIDKHETLIEK